MAHVSFVHALRIPTAHECTWSPVNISPTRPRHAAVRHFPRAQQGGSNGDNDEEEYLSAASRRRRNGRSAQELIERLRASPVETGESERRSSTAERVWESQSMLFSLRELPKLMNNRVESYLSSWPQLIMWYLVSILFGFYSASAFHTIIVSVLEWDTFSAFVLLFWVESFTKMYYKTDPRKRGILLRLANAFKIGVIYGLAVDAFKVST